MKLLFAAVAAAVYLSILWGPAFLVARQSQRRGNFSALRALRFIWPSQLVATFALLFTADTIGLQNPAGLFVAATAASSLAGAAVCKLLGWYAARQ
jgi:hypothetical protein